MSNLIPMDKAATMLGLSAERLAEMRSNNGRVLGVTALGDNLPTAKLNAYRAVQAIRWPGAWCRKDISDQGRG